MRTVVRDRRLLRDLRRVSVAFGPCSVDTGAADLCQPRALPRRRRRRRCKPRTAVVAAAAGGERGSGAPLPAGPGAADLAPLRGRGLSGTRRRERRAGPAGAAAAGPGWPARPLSPAGPGGPVLSRRRSPQAAAFLPAPQWDQRPAEPARLPLAQKPSGDRSRLPPASPRRCGSSGWPGIVRAGAAPRPARPGPAGERLGRAEQQQFRARMETQREAKWPKMEG
ncbi:collagen alpha-2(I) chain [Manacus candei]|uniref:collagen alpha-2(I) chain n=1 Tax=Manacus candei TaxID=415023 RepID=UPI002227C303|nr:collagen alpha-2(I) chain [Manacus candei]